MSRVLRPAILVILLSICFRGLCSDSAYISIQWNGPTDKPYHGFLFYKKGGYNPMREYGENNPFELLCELSEKEFLQLKQTLFEGKKRIDTTKRSSPFFMAYYNGYFEGSKWVLSTFMNDESEFRQVAKTITEFFKGSRYDKQIRQRWLLVFERLGFKLN